jgi:hypothetical protein
VTAPPPATSTPDRADQAKADQAKAKRRGVLRDADFRKLWAGMTGSPPYS